MNLILIITTYFKNMRTLLYTLCLTFFLFTLPVNSYAIESLKLTDVIKSQGSGNIDLFKDISAPQLEQYRFEHEGVIVLGVDINEAASGTEKASTQGVSIKNVVLTIDFDDGSQIIYDSMNNCCETETQTLLAEAPDTSRRQYFTLLGETGSARISSINQIQDIFDSTLSIIVPDTLYDPGYRTAVNAVIEIQLLDTNVNLGDPEAFYDYSAGFEDIAILSRVDSDFINDYGAGRDEAPMVFLTNPEPIVDLMAVTNWNHFPTADTYYLVGYEDLYPFKGDYDFNDLTVAYQVSYGLNVENQIVSIRGKVYLITRGSAYSHNWHLNIELPIELTGNLVCTVYPNHKNQEVSRNCSTSEQAYTGRDLDLMMFEDTLDIFPDPAGSLFVNSQALYTTPWNLKFFPGPKSEFRIDFDSPVMQSEVQPAPFDPYIFVLNTTQEIHLLEVDPTYQDSSGYPFAMMIPDNWQPPLEYIDTAIAFPQFSEFVSSKGIAALNWYNSSIAEYIVDIPDSSVWAW